MKRFPLAPLVQLRAHAVDERTTELRERHARVEESQQARAQAERREREHADASVAVVSAEQSRVLDGAANAGDFALLAQYQVGANSVAQGLAQHSAVVQQRLERAERERTEAEQALAEARAERRVIENAASRHLAAQRGVAEASAEEEALEVWGSRRFRA